jgi:hypothetical protein
VEEKKERGEVGRRGKRVNLKRKKTYEGRKTYQYLEDILGEGFQQAIK